MAPYSVIGEGFQQLDHVAKARGEAKYIDDNRLPNMLYGTETQARRTRTEKGFQ
jgi:hypothetical protein